jgi:tetratricopeptide (TPR) repeat protein
LCVFSRCFQYTDEFVPELLDIIRRSKKRSHPVGDAGQKEDGFQRANGPGSEETQQRVEGSDVPFLSLKDIWDDNRVYIIAIPVIIVITTILFTVSQKHYFYKTDLISSKEASSGETGDVTPDASGQRTVLTGTAGDWYGKALLLKESTDRIDILKAVDYLNQAIRLKPDDVEAYRMRGFFYGKLDRWNLAINDYDAAIRMKPRDGSLYTMRGNAHFALGKISLACSDAKKACTFGHCTLIREAKNDGDCL